MKKIILVTMVLTTGSAGVLSAGEVKEKYEQQCAKCHGADGKGNTKMGKKYGVKDYSDPKVQAALADEQAFKSVKEGKKDGDKVVKKPVEGLTDDEIRALVKHMRTFTK